jgi:peptide/nickel transport system substrate-binding protein
MKRKKTFGSTLLNILIILTMVALPACQNRPEASTTLTYGLTLAPSGIDPHLNASNELGIPLRSVYDTLVYLDQNSGEFVPGLAESWSISDDSLTYTFVLRRDVTFHDGEQFNAQAVIANFDYIQDPDNHSQKALSMLGPIEAVIAVDDFTVEIVLREPYAPLLDSLSQVYLGIASPAALEQWGPTEYQFHQVGSGPYRFIEYVPNDHLTLERNPDYDWGPSIYNRQSAEIVQIIFRFYEDPATRALALENGEVDIIGEVPQLDAERLAASGEFELYPIAIPGQPLQYFFNTATPPTDDINVRRALIHAVDRQSIVETIFGTYSPVASGPLSSNTFGASDLGSSLSYDPDLASDLLAQSGWELDDATHLWMRDGQTLSLILVAPPWGSNPEVAQLISAEWQELGAEVSVEIAPGFGPLKEAQTSGNYHAIGINFFGTDPDQLRAFFSSEGLYNWANLNDADIDRLLVTGSVDTTDARVQVYAELHRLLAEAAVLLPIRDYVNLVVARAEVSNLRYDAQGWNPILIDLSLVQ